MSGVVYLIHFERAIGSATNPRGRAQHYLGWSAKLGDRMDAHRHGNGARLMEVLAERGVAWTLVRTWQGPRSTERRLKNWHKARQLCPLCNKSQAKHLHRSARNQAGALPTYPVLPSPG